MMANMKNAKNTLCVAPLTPSRNAHHKTSTNGAHGHCEARRRARYDSTAAYATYAVSRTRVAATSRSGSYGSTHVTASAAIARITRISPIMRSSGESVVVMTSVLTHVSDSFFGTSRAVR